MSERNRTTPAPESATPSVPNLRPVEFPADEHPDTRPCPPWCWIVTDNPDGYSHEVEEHRLMSAVHTTTEAVDTRASFYPASHDRREGKVTTATLESQLQMVGQGVPTIRIALRDYPRIRQSDGSWRMEQRYNSKVLTLSAEDARELAAVLTYLADLSEVQS